MASNGQRVLASKKRVSSKKGVPVPPKRNSCAPKKESLAFNWELVSVIANTSVAMAN